MEYKTYVKHETIQAKLLEKGDGFSEQLVGKHYVINHPNGTKELREKTKFEQEYEEQWKI